jgi:Spy/CpxP family protein refolding chaperone
MMGDRLAKELNLTPDQQNQLKPVFEETRTKVQAIHQDTSLSQEQKRAKIKEIHDANKSKIEAVLTPEQKQKFDSLRKERGRKGRGGHGGPEGRGGNEAPEGHEGHEGHEGPGED